MEHHIIGVLIIVTSLTDTSLTHSNVATVVSSVSVDRLRSCLHVPDSVKRKIFNHFIDEDQRRDQIIHYWRNTYPFHEASWAWLAGRLHWCEETTALTAAKIFFKRVPGVYVWHVATLIIIII